MLAWLARCCCCAGRRHDQSQRGPAGAPRSVQMTDRGASYVRLQQALDQAAQQMAQATAAAASRRADETAEGDSKPEEAVEAAEAAMRRVWEAWKLEPPAVREAIERIPPEARTKVHVLAEHGVTFIPLEARGAAPQAACARPWGTGETR